jgi:hypothetical protein
MDPELIAVFARSAERLLIAVGGLLGLYFGFRLFLARILKGQDAVFETGTITIKLVQVGPGVFFALFGAAVMIYAIIHPLSFEQSNVAQTSTPSQTPSGKTPSIATSKLSYYNDAARAAARTTALRKCQAINTARQVLDNRIQHEPSESPERIRLLAVKEELAGERDSTIGEIFGLDDLKLARSRMDEFAEDPKRLSESERNTLKEIKPWYVDELAL